jgi:hypothetical protein
MDKWTPENRAAAVTQGWNVYDIWDERKERFEQEVQRDEKSNIFLNDEAARMYVYQRAHGGDALATKAAGLVFRSKVGDFTNKRKKT